MRSTATMLYGHIETMAQRVDHLRRLRTWQDETGGFTGFVPFAFEAEGARRDSVLTKIRHATAFEELKNLAISRIYLDNFDHITAYWVSLGLPLAQQALNYGVDDLHGTIMEEKIFHMAGATTPQQQSCATLEKAIREAGREPMQRDTWYRRIELEPGRPAPPRSWPSALRSYPALAGRVGCVQYQFQSRSSGYDGPVIFDHPSGLARDLAADRLDVALVPTFEALRSPHYTLVKGVGIACDGPVYSVFLAHRGPLAELHSVALDPASLTSVHLLQVLLRRNAPGASARARPGLAEGDAALIIGNQAIDFRGSATRSELPGSSTSARNGSAARACPLSSPRGSCDPACRTPRRSPPICARSRPTVLRISKRSSVPSRATRPSPGAISHNTSILNSASRRKRASKFRELLAKHDFITDARTPLRYV